MFDTLLIANRGEIACRVISTARRMGIRTVAIFSDADANARHVALADEAMRIGAAPAAESYLRVDAILAAAKATGAQAIHPGYGFLSENPEFVEAVEAAGLVFVGPPAAAIRAMGLKDAAKAAMEKAGVPVVPGYHGSDQSPEGLAAEAGRIGYPVLIKARAGGGGKGMRLVERAEDFADALSGAQREGQASFGDPRVLVEKFVTSPRHIEIQVFADGHGNAVHLFERDCSLQRRHQKVIEEAPAPGMPETVRAAMGAAAVEAARAIGYVGAGTVEFIADGSGPLREDGFWFMEMNTRLQVEHPVTEAITGLDLVELQLRVAAGATLPFAQGDLAIDGHAFEARLYAEDAKAGFLPATGTLGRLAFPEATVFARGPVRIDAGVRTGDSITPYYDPMIAKLIVHGPDRDTALAQLSAALGATEVAGTVTNIGFLKRLADHAGFRAGEVDTGLIARDLDVLTAEDTERLDRARRIAFLVALGLVRSADANDPWDMSDGWRAWGTAEHRVSLSRHGERCDGMVRLFGGGVFEVDGSKIAARLDGDTIVLSEDGKTARVGFHSDRTTITVFDSGETSVFTRIDHLETREGVAEGGDVVLAPMPGMVTKVHVAVGAAVEEGAALLVLEAMKMEHTLRAPRTGIVAEVLASDGGQVQNGMVLVRLEDAADG
ncbi:MAG: acetyl/propionyl/methylcrotonyl-CoA carboxylase subunit alpha [Silicimonas sp.]|nr:acetyl/propionyl/methylcrotonyl-CoA carboxylase subunit alpha [Silicimonas sp.]